MHMLGSTLFLMFASTLFIVFGSTVCICCCRMFLFAFGGRAMLKLLQLISSKV
jgi:hypothetical protein